MLAFSSRTRVRLVVVVVDLRVPFVRGVESRLRLASVAARRVDILTDGVELADAHAFVAVVESTRVGHALGVSCQSDIPILI